MATLIRQLNSAKKKTTKQIQKSGFILNKKVCIEPAFITFLYQWRRKARTSSLISYFTYFVNFLPSVLSQMASVSGRYGSNKYMSILVMKSSGCWRSVITAQNLSGNVGCVWFFNQFILINEIYFPLTDVPFYLNI